MKGKNRALVKGSCVTIAVIVAFFLITLNKASAGSILISVAEFTTDGGTYTAPGDFYKSFSEGYLSGSASDPCFLAAVKIPANARKVTNVTVYLTDDGTGTANPWFQLDAIDMATGTVDNYTAVEVTTGTITIQPIGLPLSHNNLVKGRVYQLGTCLDAGQKLYGAKVFYSLW